MTRAAPVRRALGQARALLAALAAFVLVFLIARTARAQRVELSANVDSDTVEIGAIVTYSQQVMVHGGPSPTQPKPGPTPGFALHGATSGPVHMRMSVNGAVDEINGLTTSWTLRADKLGTFTLGPSQITALGTRRTTAPVRVTVVAPGKGGAARPRGHPSIDPFGGSPFGSSPLDPFKGLFDFGDDEPRAEPSADPRLAMDAPRAPVAFLHAVADKTSAVVGEQVTLSVYLYEDPYARQGRPGDVHEPTANDFVKRSLLEDETRAVGVGTALVGGKLWSVKLVRKNALFPLKTGRLEIAPMSMTFAQVRVGLRASETLSVDVTEPPIAGRPSGYAIGDVGDMSLQATVAPRALPRDGAIGVSIELRGTGNLPAQLTVPVVPGVEWLEPTVREKLGPTQNDRFGGTRTFSYVVRIHKDGAVHLGEVRLPYYDADKRSYAVTRASIGIVNVAAGPGRDAGVDEPEVILAGMPKERRVLEGPRAQSFLVERPAYWFALFGSPLGCALALGAYGLFGRLIERRAAAAPTPDQVAKTRLAEAAEACRGDDAKAAMGAVARAVEAVVLSRTGVNLRGAAGDAALVELEEAGAGRVAAERIIEILRACEDARFSPGGVDAGVARETWAHAKEALDALEARSRGGKPS